MGMFISALAIFMRMARLFTALQIKCTNCRKTHKSVFPANAARAIYGDLHLTRGKKNMTKQRADNNIISDTSL